LLAIMHPRTSAFPGSFLAISFHDAPPRRFGRRTIEAFPSPILAIFYVLRKVSNVFFVAGRSDVFFFFSPLPWLTPSVPRRKYFEPSSSSPSVPWHLFFFLSALVVWVAMSEVS